MRLIYNRDYLFKGVPKTKQNVYYKRIFEFANDISREKEILSEYFKRKYSIKKMEGTKGIFKFVLDANDHSRCLIKYEDRDQQIFGEDPGIVLLMITSHDQQGELGRRLDKAFIDYSKFIEFDDAIGDDSNIDMILGKEYMRTIQILPNMSDQDFLQTLLDEDSRYIYKPSEKQYQALESNGPILLLGCAGSGKTLVEISKTLRNAHHSINQAYFTFTPSLKDMAQGYYASIKRIGRYMKRLNLKSIIKIKYRPFVKSKAPDDKQNLMNKDFTTTATNQKWVMDITYIKTVQNGWTFLASVMDLNSIMIIDYVYEKHMRKEMVIESIKQAIDKSGFTEGLMVQSDLGSQYLSYEVESLLEKYGIIHSYSRKGSPGDNSPMEAFHSVLKREYVSRQIFKDFEAAKLGIFQYIEGFYNRKRIHGSIGYKTPIKVYYSK